MAQPQQTKRQGAGAAAVTVGAGAAAAGAAATTPVRVAAAGSGALAVVTAGVLSSFITWLSALREQHRKALSDELGRFTRNPADIAGVVAQEMVLEREFARNSADRVASAMPQALRVADPAEREQRIRQILSDEERFARMRGEAMFARAIAALTRQDLRVSSPLGAFWRIGLAKDHTEGCRFMAGWPGREGRFWPWAVLDKVHPPRHYGCTSSLHGYAEAILAGWMSPSDVPDTKDAIRDAAGVVMEQDEAEALIGELQVRDALFEAGVSRHALEAITWEGVVDGTGEVVRAAE